MRQSVRLIVAFVLVVLLPAHALADWKRLRTPNFLFIGDASDGQIRRAAQKLEQFREVMLAALPGAEGTAPVPTIVFVFQNDRAFTPFKPVYEGRVTEVGGYFVRHQDLNYIAVNDEVGDAGFDVIFHEYTHFLMSNTVGRVPAWLSEGTAELYASFEVRDDGRIAIIGAPRADHVTELRNSTLMPIRELIAIDTDSPTYNEGRRRGLFYAQSWALVHYLMLGNRERSPQLATYFSRLRTGTPDDRAFSEAFGAQPEVLGDELERYVRQVAMNAVRFTFDERAEGLVPDDVEPIADPVADAYLGDLQVRMNRVDEGRARLERALEQQPGTARATAALGLIEFRAGRLDDALRLLEQAATEGPDDAFVQVAFGRALVARLGERDRDDFEQTVQRAQSVLDRAVTLDPDLLEAAALAGYVTLLAGGDLERATELLTLAAVRAPAREEYRLLLAQVLLRRQLFDDATTILGPLLSNSSRAGVGDQARTLLARVASERARAAGAEQPAGASGATPLVAPGEAASNRPSSEPPGRIPLLRQTQPGETRVLGWFRSVSCQENSRMLVVETEERTLHLRWAASGSVEFIAYVDDPPARVGCGDIEPAQRVLATFTARSTDAPEAAGDAVAIELVPEDFTPPLEQRF